MAAKHSSTQDYGRFIVPLGREKGGYLDLLGLPTNAAPAEIAARGKDYRSSIDVEFKTSRKALKERLREAEITQEDYDAQVAQLEKVKNERETEVNQLKTKFEHLQAEHRRLANAGRQREDATFGDLQTFLPGGLSELWAKLDSPLPVRQVAEDLAWAVWKVWLEGGRDKKTARLLPSSLWAESEPADLPTIMDLWQERTLVRLMLADTFWRRLRFTNQAAWDELIANWVAEVEPLSEPPADQGGPELSFPAVTSWPSLYVESLPPGDAKDDDADDETPKPEEEFDAESFLEWMGTQDVQGGLDMAAYARWKAQRDQQARK